MARGLLRLGAAGCLATGSVVLPYVLVFRLDSRLPDASIFLFAIQVLPTLIGGLVLTMCARRRPCWLDGGAFGLFMGVVAAVVAAFVDGDMPHDAAIVAAVALIVAAAGLFGLAGGALGSLLSRPFFAEHVSPRLRNVKPWHIGVAVGIADLTIVGVVALAVL